MPNKPLSFTPGEVYGRLKFISSNPDFRRIASTFLSDMGECPQGLTIERLDNHGSYVPGNCVWADWTTQGRNKRNNIVFTVQGITAPLSALCEHFHVQYGFLWNRLRLGWPVEKALLLPRYSRCSD